MVEGPGATRNGRKVQPVVGLVLTEINSNIMPPTKTKTLEGRRLESAFSVGKEVFLILGPVILGRTVLHQNENENTNTNTNTYKSPKEQQSSENNNKPIALRLHFGMNGCLTVRNPGESSKLAPWRKNDKSSKKCTIKFSRSSVVVDDELNHLIRDDTTMVIIETVASTCTVVSAFVAQSKLTRLATRDVCGGSNIFEPQAVLESILEKRSNAMVCDALLDQDRFPGVGNIIKIEGLHKAGIHPRRFVEGLSREELMKTILECRTYAMGWLSSGRAPTKRVYNQTKCGSCRTGRVRMVKMGTDLSRVTFWCEKCQPFIVTTNPTSSTKGISNDEFRKGHISKDIHTEQQE